MSTDITHYFIGYRHKANDQVEPLLTVRDELIYFTDERLASVCADLVLVEDLMKAVREQPHIHNSVSVGVSPKGYWDKLVEQWNGGYRFCDSLDDFVSLMEEREGRKIEVPSEIRGTMEINLILCFRPKDLDNTMRLPFRTFDNRLVVFGEAAVAQFAKKLFSAALIEFFREGVEKDGYKPELYIERVNRVEMQTAEGVYGQPSYRCESCEDVTDLVAFLLGQLQAKLQEKETPNGQDTSES